MDVGAFWITSELQRPFSVSFSKHRDKIRFCSIYVHPLKHCMCLVVIPWEKSPKVTDIAYLSPYVFFTSVFPFMGKESKRIWLEQDTSLFFFLEGNMSNGLFHQGCFSWTWCPPLQRLQHVMLKETLNKLQMFLIGQRCCPSF